MKNKKNLFAICITLIVVAIISGAVLVITKSGILEVKKQEATDKTANIKIDEGEEINNAIEEGQEIAEGVYEKSLEIGEKIELKEVLKTEDLTNLTLISNSNESVVSIENNIITAVTEGETEIVYQLNSKKYLIAIEVKTETSNAAATEASVGQVFFLNTHSAKVINNQKIEKRGANEAIMIKGTNGEFALIDVSNQVASDGKCPSVVDQIVKYPGNTTGKIKIKYLIISHYHQDHVVCWNSVLTSDKITIENIILKENGRSAYNRKYNNIKKVAQDKKINVIVSQTKKEGEYLSLGKTKLYLYNLSDIFKGQKCIKSNTLKFKAIKTGSDLQNMIKTNNKYFIMKGANAVSDLKATYTTSTKKETISNITLNKTTAGQIVYYAVDDNEESSICSDNANSIAVLVEFPINDNDYRYAYIPSDLENNGYPVYGRYNSTVNQTIYGTGTTYNYKIQNEELVQDTNFSEAREYWVAKAIRNKLGAANLKKITIYQQSHHGYNNALDALEILGFTTARPANFPLYAIATLPHSQRLYYTDFLQASSYMKLYSATNNGKNNLATGIGQNGILCNVTVSGKTTCGKV